MATRIPAPDEHNAWRVETPGSEGWQRSPRADAADKFFMVSTDGHVQEPSDLWATRMDAKYKDRLPGMAVSDGKKYQKTEGFRPLRIRNIEFAGEDLLRNKSGYTPQERLDDLAADGVDAENTDSLDITFAEEEHALSGKAGCGGADGRQLLKLFQEQWIFRALCR